MSSDIVDKNKPAITCLSQDPDSIFSYGLQVGYIIEGTKQLYDWHLISTEYSYGRPFKRDGYVKWANEGEHRRCSTTLKFVNETVDPFCIFSMGDIQHHDKIYFNKNLQTPWISYFPWDNEDPNALINNKEVINAPDIKVTMSKFAKSYLENYGVEVDDMIYNIVDTSSFKPIEGFRKGMNDMNKSLEGKKILLFVGRPNWRKNLEFLLGAFNKLLRMRDDVLLYLHVDFNDEARGKPHLEKLIHALSLNDKVIPTESNEFAKGVPKSKLNSIYNLSDLYITTHSGEGFGLPICESMACGKPFVATDYTTTREFAGPNNERGIGAKLDKYKMDRGIMRGWVDIKDFVEKINYLLDRPELMKEMGENGKKWVNENCSPEAVIPKWKKVFDKLSIPTCNVSERNIEVSWSEMTQ